MIKMILHRLKKKNKKKIIKLLFDVMPDILSIG